MLDNLKKAFDEMNKGASQLRSSAANLRNKIAQLENERSSLLTLPITANDYVELIQADIDRIADKVQKRLALQMELAAMGHADNGSYRATVAFAMQGLAADRPRMIGSLRSCSGGDFDTEELRQDIATYFLRDEMKRAAADAVGSIEKWPFPDAVPMAKSKARIREIDDELNRINSELLALEQQATDLGLHI